MSLLRDRKLTFMYYLDGLQASVVTVLVVPKSFPLTPVSLSSACSNLITYFSDGQIVKTFICTLYPSYLSVMRKSVSRRKGLRDVQCSLNIATVSGIRTAESWSPS